MSWTMERNQELMGIVFFFYRIVCGEARGRFFNSLRPSDAYMRQLTRPSLVQIMACRLVGAKPLSEPMLEYCYFKP